MNPLTLRAMRFLSSVLIAVLFGLVPFVAAGQPASGEFDVLDAIVAVVGDGIVLESDIEAQVFNETVQGRKVDADDRCVILEDILRSKLLVHQAKLDSLEVTEDEVMEEIERRLAYYIRMFGTVEAFEAEYGQTVSQWKAEFADPIREQLLAGRMQATINEQVRATPAEVQAFYAATPSDSLPLIPEAVSYSELVLQPAITEAQKARVRNTLDSIRTQVSLGKMSMTLAASRYSEDPGSKYKGGCYENIGRGQFVPEFEAAAFETPIGDFSPVFETDFGFHFLRVTDRRGEQFSACHVLMSAKVDPVALENLHGRADSIAAALDAGDLNFRDAVLRYSTREETRNASGVLVNPRDGSTHWGPDELDPNLSILFSTMEPGDLSEPIQLLDEDEQGYWAILQLDARFPAHRANPRDDFSYFQSAVENQIRNEQLTRWYNERIEEVYIRIDAPYEGCETELAWR